MYIKMVTKKNVTHFRRPLHRTLIASCLKILLLFQIKKYICVWLIVFLVLVLPWVNPAHKDVTAIEGNYINLTCIVRSNISAIVQWNVSNAEGKRIDFPSRFWHLMLLPEYQFFVRIIDCLCNHACFININCNILIMTRRDLLGVNNIIEFTNFKICLLECFLFPLCYIIKKRIKKER